MSLLLLDLPSYTVMRRPLPGSTGLTWQTVGVAAPLRVTERADYALNRFLLLSVHEAIT